MYDGEYYNGLVFKGYISGLPRAVLSGGRYDKLLEHFGVGMPAIGFGVVIEYVMNALDRQDIEIPLTDKKEMIIYTRDCYAKALALAKEKRASGCFVALTAWQDGISEKDYRQLADRHAATCCFVCR